MVLALLPAGAAQAQTYAPAPAQPAPSAAPSPAAPQPAACQFVLGFKTLHDLDAGDVGDCVDNQATVASGDAQQHTSKGLLVWRHADNWTAFTNGYTTWINGPDGLVSRLNTGPLFPWETPPPAATPAASPGPAPAASPAPSASGKPGVSYDPNGYPVNAKGPCVKQVGAQVKHEAGAFYRLEVKALDGAGAPVPGAFGSYNASYTDGYWPLFDVTDSTGFGWNAWQVVGAKGNVTVNVAVSSGGCVATTSTTFQV